jgi:hypothetical protein
MRRAILALVALALVLAACASPIPSPTPSPTAGSSTPPGLAGIAARYLEVASALNEATCTFNAVLSRAAPTLADLKRGSTAYATGLAALINGLRAIDWPAELAEDAYALIDAKEADETLVRAMAAADSLAEFITADDQLIEANRTSAAAASQLRRDLGLASAGNPCAS